MDEITATKIVTTLDGKVVLRFREDGVHVQLSGDTAVIPWGEWQFIANVYGKRGSLA